MKKAFTLIELLVVIAIIAILAAMLMPALQRAQGEAKKSNCRTNLHNLGLALEMLRNDNAGLYPGLVDDTAVANARKGVYLSHPLHMADFEADGMYVPGESWVQQKGGPWFQLVASGYLDDVDSMDCPGVDAEWLGAFYWGRPYLRDCNVAAETRIGGNANEGKDNAINNERYPDLFGTWGCNVVSGVEYGYDIGRIHINSNAARVVMGDVTGIDHSWGGNYGMYVPHANGCNLLFVDNAVQWVLKDYPDVKWLRGNNDYPTNNSYQPWDKGYVGNPRMDEDKPYYKLMTYLSDADKVALENDLDADIDDVYAIEQVVALNLDAHDWVVDGDRFGTWDGALLKVMDDSKIYGVEQRDVATLVPVGPTRITKPGNHNDNTVYLPANAKTAGNTPPPWEYYNIIDAAVGEKGVHLMTAWGPQPGRASHRLYESGDNDFDCTKSIMDPFRPFSVSHKARGGGGSGIYKNNTDPDTGLRYASCEWYIYEQRGIFATEPRWSKHDARLLNIITPNVRWGGPGLRFEED